MPSSKTTRCTSWPTAWGGHRAGDVASKLATEAIVDFFRATATEDFTWPFHFDSRLSEEENRLLTGIRIANRQIVDRSARSREYHGMGTTVVGCLFSPRKKKMYIGHVGDSRAYRVRGGQIKQMTRDHSLVNDYLLAMPELTEEQRSELPKNVITRALGMQEHVSVDLQADDAQVGDAYLLCSDGLSGMIEDDEILALVQSSPELAWSVASSSRSPTNTAVKTTSPRSSCASTRVVTTTRASPTPCPRPARWHDAPSLRSQT